LLRGSFFPDYFMSNPFTPIHRTYVQKLIQPLLAALAVCCVATLEFPVANAQTPAPGTLDSTFNPVLDNLAFTIYAMKALPDGKTLAGGDFSKINGVTQRSFTRLTPNGTVDPAFQGLVGADDSVRAIAVQPDGKIVVGGDFSTINGASWKGLARLNADGTPDSTFGSFAGISSYGYVKAVAVQPDGKILIGGNFSQVNGVSRNYFARVNTNGSLDVSFSAPADDHVNAIVVRPNGKILVGGAFTHLNNQSHNHLVQLNADGTTDSSFNVDVDDIVQTIVLQSNNQIFIGGWFYYVNGSRHEHIARLNSDGTTDNAFTASTSGNVYTLALQWNGKILVGGSFNNVNGSSRNKIACLNPNGLLDSTFDTGVGPDSTVLSITVQSDGKSVIGGEFSNVASVGRTRMARLFGDPPPPPPAPEGVAMIYPAVEIGWASVTNGLYQIQWSSEVDPSNWQDFGSPIAGNGMTNWIYDTTRGGPKKFYRVIKLQ